MTAVLVAGVGNIFAGDDAFGVEVARRLASRPLPAGARVRDFGNRAIDLAYALLDECDAMVLVDAAARGGPPGTLYVLEPDVHQTGSAGQSAERQASADAAASASPAVAATHELDPNAVLRMIAVGPARCRRVFIVGCEPQTLGDDRGADLGLSAPVAEAVERAITLVESIVNRMMGETA